MPKTVLQHDPIPSETAKAKHANVKRTQDFNGQNGSSHSRQIYFHEKFPHVQNAFRDPHLARISAQYGCKSQRYGAHRESFSHHNSDPMLRKNAKLSSMHLAEYVLQPTKGTEQ